MSEKRFAIKPQDDYWAVIDNHNDDKVCIINGIHTEIEAIWLCDFMNEQQATIQFFKGEIDELKKDIDIYKYEEKKHSESARKLYEENEQLKKRLEHYKEVEAMNGDGKNE